MLTPCYFSPSFISSGANLEARLAVGQREVGAGFCPQKGVWQPLAASQTLCLPHLRVGKTASPPPLNSIRTAGRSGVVSFSPPLAALGLEKPPKFARGVLVGQLLSPAYREGTNQLTEGIGRISRFCISLVTRMRL